MAEANQGNPQTLATEQRKTEPQATGGGQRMEPYRGHAEHRGNSLLPLMRRMLSDMDRLFGDFGSPSLLASGEESWAGQFWAPQIDIFERDQTLVVHADLPGLRQEDVKVSVDRGMLTISGQRRQESANERGQDHVHRRERSFGSFQRAISLPENTDPARIRASFENGVLEVTVPMPEEAKQKGREIPIGPKLQSGPQH